MKCKKCQSPGTVILRKKDAYCEYCFTTNANHKFRACIGKNKILSKNEKVLVCLSGGPGSIVLLELIHIGLGMESHKKLRILPFFLHITDTKDAKSHSISKSIIQQCMKYGFGVYIVPVSEFANANSKLPKLNEEATEQDLNNQYYSMIASMSATVHNDLQLRIRRHLFVRFARLLECSFIFTAETTTTLAIHLLSNIVIGRGSQVENDVGFCDTRDENIKIIRPMRDITKEELECYIKCKGLLTECKDTMNDNSLQSVIETFVTNLQNNYPATISTVCKTADKMSVYETKNINICLICESKLGAISKLTALEATNFSRMVSHEKQLNWNPNNVTSERNAQNEINKYLCYGCGNNYSNDKNSDLPNCLLTLLCNKKK